MHPDIIIWHSASITVLFLILLRTENTGATYVVNSVNVLVRCAFFRAGLRIPNQGGADERAESLAKRRAGKLGGQHPPRDAGHVIPLNERHLLRLSQHYLRYYHEDRTHIGLNNEGPGARQIES
jgi:hypothetical protein